MEFKFKYEFESDIEYFKQVKDIVESLEILFEIDYKDLELAMYPEIIYKMFEIVKSSTELTGDKQLTLMKDILMVIIDKTKFAKSYEAMAILLTPKMVDNFIGINDDGKLYIKEIKPPGLFIQNILVCVQGCMVKSEIKEEIIQIKEERKENILSERDEIHNMDQKYRNDLQYLAEIYNNEVRQIPDRNSRVMRKRKYGEDVKRLKEEYQTNRTLLIIKHRKRREEEVLARREAKENYNKERHDMKIRQKKELDYLKQRQKEMKQKEYDEEMTRIVIRHKSEQQNLEIMYRPLLA
jgi:hypothetical protein